MEIKKPNDILVATLNNPQLTPYDLLSNNITGENTSLLPKEKYKESKYVQDAFKKENGEFDDISFDKAYSLAQNNFYQLTNAEYLKGLDEMAYSPFDITRPKFAKTIKVGATLEKEYNPFKERKGWTGIGSIDASNLSLRELAQQGKIFDPSTNSWSDESLNDLSILDKVFGDTLVYAQYDEDGSHLDNRFGSMVEHKKGDWKVNDQGDLFIEKLAGREIYGKQVVNPMDTLTTDGSLVNQFDFLDSDGREKSLTGTAFKIAFELAPFLIPSFGALKGAASIPALYGGIKAAIGLATVMPTFYKALEGMLMGDTDTTLTKGATQLEGWMSKYAQTSTSDAGSESLFSIEQMSGMVSSIFSQIYEQRAAASLAKAIYRGEVKMTAGAEEMAKKINQKLLTEVIDGKIAIEDVGALSKAAMEKIPELQSLINKQSQLSKALSLGYMALTSTGDIYGEAIQGGYDKRTAGFAALAAASGQYAIMMNNRMGNWFLDKTTGYSIETNKALMSKSLKPWLEEVQKGFSLYTKDGKAGKAALASTFSKMKNSIQNIFTTPSVIGEAMWKNSLIEGVEEVTEQMVLDATKGMVDTMSYLGLTKKQGTFGGLDTAFSKAGFENYLANFVGGLLGGAMFEFHRSKIAPWLDPNMMTAETQKSVYELVAAGHKDDLITIINSQRSKLGNKFITALDTDGSFKEADENSISQADLIANKAIEMINVVDGILNSHDLIHTDEEIVSKAIMDHIIINDLKKATATGSHIGLEGLVLEDYKTKMSKIVKLQGKINNTPDTEENAKVLKDDKAELKIYVDNVNEILEGKYGSAYFRRAQLYLSKQIHKPFLNISKTDFAKEKYKVDFHSLPDSGLGLTKEKIDAEWNEYLNSKDLKQDLELADKIYTALEQELNAPIAAYAESGYDVERKESLNNILDLRATIKMFNTAGSAEEKSAALESFIEINNKLDNKTSVAPWTVLHNDIFDQLDNLGLLKKAEYVKDATGAWKVITSDFSNAELAETDIDTQETKKDKIKNIVQQYFKQFSMNPMNAETVITNINAQIDRYNIKISDQIEILEAKVNKTPEEEIQLTKLKNSLMGFKIDSFANTNAVKAVVDASNTEVNDFLIAQDVTMDQLNEYRLLKANEQMFSKDYKTFMNQFGTEDWKQLDADGLKKVFDELLITGLYDETLSGMAAIATNTDEEVRKALNMLNDPALIADQLIDIQNTLEPFMQTVEKVLNEGKSILDNTDLKETEDGIAQINNKLQEQIREITPEILKIHNYALDLLIKSLKSGNADREVFLEAERLTNEEITQVISSVFPDSTGTTYELFNKIITEVPALLTAIENNNQDFKNQMPDAYNDLTTLREVIESESAAMVTNPNYKGIFPSPEFMLFVKNSFGKDASLITLKGAMEGALKALDLNKKSIERIDKFLELQSKGIKLKSNTLYDFIRKFELTLDSNSSNSVNKVFDILEREETTLKSSSNVTNFLSDNIREQDITQAINHLEMVKAVIAAMSTTQVSFGDPYGFIQSRINYAKKYKQDDDVLKLKTITSDVATLMSNDIDVLITKLKFLQDLAGFNSGKMMNEQEVIRDRVEDILLKNWNEWTKVMNPSFLPLDKIKDILASSESSTSKLMKVESAIFLHNINNKEAALEEFLKHLQNVNADVYSHIDKEVSTLESWDLAVYFATTLALNSQNFNIRTFMTTKGEFSKAPFYTQELATKVLKASTVNPNLFAKIYTIKQNTAKATADFISVILGGAGTGKTTAVIGLLLDNVRQTNEKSNLWITAPTELQKNNLMTAILESVGTAKITADGHSKSELFAKLGLTEIIETIRKEINNANDGLDKKYVKLDPDSKILLLTEEALSNEWITQDIIARMEGLPNLLLIDEVTHFSSFELYFLNEISRYSYNHDNLNFMKIIAAGDPTQLGHLVKVENDYYSYNIDSVNAIFTPRLWSSIRATNNQKRINNERFVRATREVVNIYDKNKSEYKKAESESLAYLQTVEDVNVLSYYQKGNTLAGDKIVTDLDKETVTLLATILKNKPNTTIGFLTKDGTLPTEWNQLLSDAGIIDPASMSNIKLFTPDNVQGSEVDYFVFDANLIGAYDKVRDNLKAFYTFMSRSKTASIIVDKNNVLKNLSIRNGKADNYSVPFEPLTENAIKAAKTKRIGELTTLLGENPVPTADDNFKWKMANGEGENSIESIYVGAEPEESIVTPTAFSAEEKAKEDEELKSDFRIMMHTFYNNPGAIVDKKTKEITINTNNPPTDLNFSADVDGTEAQDVIDDWLKLKNFLLHNKTVGSVISSDYNNFFTKAFTGISSERVKVEIVLSATAYDTDINNAYGKQGFDPDATLKPGDLFINLTAKLTFGQATHYVTLASMGTQEQIVKKAAEYKVSVDDINNRFTEIAELLSNSGSNMITFGISNLDSFDFLTSTRLVKVKNKPTDKSSVEFTLDTLHEQFPGIKFSEIRFFPNNEQRFYDLLNSYTFGTARFTGPNFTPEMTKAALKRLWWGDRDSKGNLVPDANGKVYTGLRNKPYIVASTRDDLNGNPNNNKTQATLIAIGAHSRKLSGLIKEVETLLDERKEEVFSAIASNQPIPTSERIDAKSETLLNRSNILDILIKWGMTSSDNGTLLDLLFEEIEFSVSDQVTGSKTSVFEIFNKFRQNKPSSSIQGLKDVVNLVKDAIKNNGANPNAKDIKKTIIKQLPGMSRWHWMFFNIFAYEKIIDGVDAKEFKELMLKGQVDDAVFEAFNESKGSDRMKNILKQLMVPLQDFAFFYSIPVKPPSHDDTLGPLVANKYMGNGQKFDKDFFADKFFINSAPEGPRMLFNLGEFLTGTSTAIPATPIATPTPAPAPVVAPIVPVVPKAAPTIVTAPIISTESVTVINDITAKISHVESRIALNGILGIVSEKLGDSFTTMLEGLDSSDAFTDGNDVEKTILLLQTLGMKIKDNMVQLASIPTALNLDRLADKELIINLKEQINKVLDNLICLN